MQIKINLILIRATFAFISLVGVTFDIAVVFLKLFLLKNLLKLTSLSIPFTFICCPISLSKDYSVSFRKATDKLQQS